MHSLHRHSDAELIQFFTKGKDAALEVLINRYKDKIYTSIYMLVKDKYMAEDIFQDAFLKMIKTMREGRYAEQGQFLPWAMRVAHNLCMDHFRRTKGHIPISLPDGRDIAELIPQYENACDNLERRQTHTSVRDLVAELPDEQKEVIVMRMYADLSFKEIADMSGVSINTALGRMRYGLINLRKLIQERQLALR